MPDIPPDAKMRIWCESALNARHENAALALRIVDDEEMLSLNTQFRQKTSTTNVLSFPCELPPELELDELGDIVICAPVVEQEAKDQNKPRDAHWAHMIVHGTLHLQGYDHIEENEAEEMEALEDTIITALGFPPPYAT